MAVNASPFGPCPQFELSSGAPAVGNLLFFYAAGTTTKVNTYTSSTGATPNPNPIVLNSLGQTPNEVWFTNGQSYKMVYAPSTDTDPPTNPIRTFDNLWGINDTSNTNSSTISEWILFSGTPSYLSATQFTIAGNQTVVFEVGRRVKTTNTSGTIYSTITAVSFSSVTTVTVTNDSGVLDSGLSAVSYGLLSYQNNSYIAKVATTATTSTNSTNLTGGSAGTIPYQSAAGVTAMLAAGTSGQALLSNGAAPPSWGSFAAPRSALNGCTLSTAGASTTMSIAAGAATDSTQSFYMQLASSINKTTGAWAVGTGNGGLDTGSLLSSCFGATCSFATNVMTCTVAPTSGTFAVGQRIHMNTLPATTGGLPVATFISSLGTGTGGTGTYNLSTTPGTITAQTCMGLSWYYFYLIRRPDTGVVEVLFSANATTPTLPTNYTQYRYIGADFINASGNWEKFYQSGLVVNWDTVRLDFNSAGTPTANRLLAPLIVPPGRKVTAIVNSQPQATAVISNPATVDNPSTATTAGNFINSTTSGSQLQVITDTNCQVGFRGSVAGSLYVSTTGYIDLRDTDL